MHPTCRGGAAQPLLRGDDLVRVLAGFLALSASTRRSARRLVQHADDPSTASFIAALLLRSRDVHLPVSCSMGSSKMPTEFDLTLQRCEGSLTRGREGRATPSVATLWAVASELGLSWEISSAAAGPRSAPRLSRRRAAPEAWTVITLAGGGVRWERLTVRPDHDVDFISVCTRSAPSRARPMRCRARREGVRLRGQRSAGRPSASTSTDQGRLSITFEPHRPHRLGDQHEPAVASGPAEPPGRRPTPAARRDDRASERMSTTACRARRRRYRPHPRGVVCAAA